MGDKCLGGIDLEKNKFIYSSTDMYTSNLELVGVEDAAIRFSWLWECHTFLCREKDPRFAINMEVAKCDGPECSFSYWSSGPCVYFFVSIDPLTLKLGRKRDLQKAKR